MRRKTTTVNLSCAGISVNRGWCRRAWGKVFYVGSVQGDGGKDWGWTDDINQAIELSPYWQRRYRADRRACGIPFAAQ